MKTIALRFADNFAPEGGTIEAHNEIIKQYGYVWYGKHGAAVSQKVIDEVMKNDKPKVLLIHSGKLVDFGLMLKKSSTISQKRKLFQSTTETPQEHSKHGSR